MFRVSCLAVCCVLLASVAAQLNDLDNNNCGSLVADSTCASPCDMPTCYDTSTTRFASFPDDGFCEVYNTSHTEDDGIVAYTVAAQICLYSIDHPQGTGIAFNWQSIGNYDVVYKEDQDSTICKYGFVNNNAVTEDGQFDCIATNQENWHVFRIAVTNPDGTFSATVELQDGTTVTVDGLQTTSNYDISARGGVLMINNGDQDFLEFSRIDIESKTVDPCFSDPCSNGGTCEFDGNGFSCLCPPEFTGGRCETAVIVECYACSWTPDDDNAYRRCINDPENAPGIGTVDCDLSTGRQCYYDVTYDPDTLEPESIFRGCDEVAFVPGCRDETVVVCGDKCSTQLCNGQNCTVPPFELPSSKKKI